jgi:serine/threonine-protein kinase RsbW
METMETVTLTVPAHTRYLSLVRACAAELCHTIESLSHREQVIYDIQLVVSEAVTNAMLHAYGSRPDGRVQVVFSLLPGRLEIDVYDWGEGFDPTAVPKPDLEEPGESGYGLMIIRSLMDEVGYRRDPVQGNRLHLVKRVGGAT